MPVGKVAKRAGKSEDLPGQKETFVDGRWLFRS